MTLIQAWQRQGSRSPALTLALKELFIVTLRYNFTVTLHHIPGAINPADFPSRILSDLDCTLTLTACQQIQHLRPTHLMALPANVLPDTSGQPLKFFSPFPVQGAAGVNIFAQCLAPSENAYVFPPFVLIGPLLKFLEGQHISYSIVVPDDCSYLAPLLLLFALAIRATPALCASLARRDSHPDLNNGIFGCFECHVDYFCHRSTRRYSVFGNQLRHVHNARMRTIKVFIFVSDVVSTKMLVAPPFYPKFIWTSPLLTPDWSLCNRYRCKSLTQSRSLTSKENWNRS